MEKLLPFEEALAIVRREAGAPDRVALELREAFGHVLLEDACADRDLPPFDRAMMDGYALRAADTQGASPEAPAELAVIESVPAGRSATQTVNPGQAIRIMTGAPVPAGADAVVRIEDTEALDGGSEGGRVRVKTALRPERNIARRASDRKRGDVLVPAGSRIGPAEVGVLAAVGMAKASVGRQPRLAVLGSGDELVEPAETPGPSQIRNSNSYQLIAQAASHGWAAEYLGIAPDDPARTRRLIERGLAADVFISTGGVSVGARDYVREAFEALGVELFFRKLAIKPGKPTVFGRRARTLVFGLPGNPVAALVGFHLFVATAVRARLGQAEPAPRVLHLPLEGAAPEAGGRVTFRPARLLNRDGAARVALLEWHGSADLAACAGAGGFVRQAAGECLAGGQAVPFYPLPGAR